MPIDELSTEAIVNRIQLEKDAKVLMAIIDFDIETCEYLVLTFANQLNLGLKKIHDAYNMEAYDVMANVLHQLKGASGTVRIDRIKKNIELAELLVQEGKYEKAITIIEQVDVDPLIN